MSTNPAQSPRLTIVIPTVNRAALVGRAIDSALAQTYPAIEIIVSNNGSTDGTQEVLKQYSGSSRLRILEREKTVPVEVHSAILLGEISGEFSLALSDDDWLEPEFAEKAMSLYDRHPEISFVWTGCLMHYGDVAIPGKTGPESERGTDFFAGFLAGKRDICWCACVMRTTDLKRLLPHPPGIICGDVFCWIQAATSASVGCVSDSLSHYTAYRDQGDGMAGGAPVLTWAKEMECWARKMVALCEEDVSQGPRLEIIRRDAAEFVARSTANQFVWNRLRGESPFALLKSFRRTLRFLLGGQPSSWIRVVASIVAPRRLLRKVMLDTARLRAPRRAAAGGE